MSDELAKYGDNLGKLLIEDAKQRAMKENLVKAGGVVTNLIADITNSKRIIERRKEIIALSEARLKAIEENKFVIVEDDPSDPLQLGRPYGPIRYDDESLNKIVRE